MKANLSIPIDTYRTHNRNRSLSFTNSEQLVNVNKGSRHIEPVTLGKRLALMVGHRVSSGMTSTYQSSVAPHRANGFRNGLSWSLVRRWQQRLAHFIPCAASD